MIIIHFEFLQQIISHIINSIMIIKILMKYYSMQNFHPFFSQIQPDFKQNIIQKYLMFIVIFFFLIRRVYSQIYNLESGYYYGTKWFLHSLNGLYYNVYNYGVEHFGDLSNQQYALSFFVKVNPQQSASQSYIMSINTEQTFQIELICNMQGSNLKFDIYVLNTLQSLQFSTTNWYQIIAQNTGIQICNYITCKSVDVNLPFSKLTRINLFQDKWFVFWQGQAYGVTLYKGINSQNFFLLQNSMQPEAIVNLNIQEKIQSKITVDYSEYEYIAKLGQYFNFDGKDPLLQQNSLIFNNSQFIDIKDPVLKETFTIEFRLQLSNIYNSDIILFNYTLSNQYQLFIFFNASFSINVQLNGQNQQFNLITTQVIHFCLGVIHKLELNFNYYQLYFIQLSDDQVINKIYPSQFQYLSSQTPFKSGKGSLQIGSSSNKFYKDQYLELFHFRLYQGFFYDDQGIIDPTCKFYLGDRCIICKKGYILSINHICLPNCTSSVVLTEYIKSHNQCLRSCHTICATCKTDDANICLSCSGNLINPPQCVCPPKYFEDNVSANCRQYFQEIQTQSGFIKGDCQIQTEIIVNFDIPYNSIPTVEVSLQGHEYYFHWGTSTIVKVQVKDISKNNFKIQFNCASPHQQYYVQWISSIGNDKFNVIQQSIPQNTGNLQITVPSPQIINNQLYTTLPHFKEFQTFSQVYGYGSSYFNSQNQTTTSYKINCAAKINDVGLFQSNFLSYFYRNFTQLAEIPLQDIPKSISAINIITESDSSDSSNFNFLHKYRSSKLYQIQNNYQTSKIAGYLLFTATQCQGTTQSCDFYQSYITSCSYNSLSVNVTKLDTSSTQKMTVTFVIQIVILVNQHIAFVLRVDNINIQINLQINASNAIKPVIHCLSCSQDRKLTQDHQCVCQIGYYNEDLNCIKCEKSCQKCVNPTQCSTCTFDKYLDQSTNLCICLEGLYETQDSKCQVCNSQCKTCNNSDSCLSCVKNKSLQNGKCVCSQGYYKIDQDCFPCDDGKGIFYLECKLINCFDGIWSPYEECDDGNLIGYDGCTNCRIDSEYQCINRLRQKSICYKCQQNCQDCQYSNYKIQCQQCKEGYFLNQNICIKCSQYCKTCEQSSTKCLTCQIQDQDPDSNKNCKGCDQGYYFSKDQCISQCGDGIKTLDEQCDDGNLSLGDGCNQNCQIEALYQCNQFNSLSLCTRLIKPQIYVNQNLKQSSSSYFVQIQSPEPVMFKNIQLQLKSDQQNISEIFNYSPNYQTKFEGFIILQINLTIDFNVSIADTQLTFQIDGDVHNQQNLQLEQNQLQLKFKDIIVLSESQNLSSSRISDQASSQMIATLVINCFSILLSGSDQLSLMLRANNILSYIKFIDINVAPNLMQLLQSLEDFNVIDKMNMINSFNNLNVGTKIEFEYIDPGSQFNKYQVNANFISNIMPFILNIISGYLFVVLLQIQLFFIEKLLKSRQKSVSTINQIYYKILSFYQVYAQKLINQFKNKGIQQLLEASQYKIIFSICLQLKVSSFNDFQNIYRFIITSVFLACYIKIVLKNLSSIDDNLRYRGIRLFNIVVNFNPFIYILSIVFLQQFILCQLVLIQLMSVSMIGVIINFPYKRMQYNIQTLIEDICLLLLFSSFIIFIYNPQQIDYILLGFIQSGFIIVMLISNIIIQLYANFLYIQQIYANYQIKIEKQRSRAMKRQFQMIYLPLN
ncbi:hypothetical protein pb186bvf_010380 [Paramecium bursaria]